MGVGSGTALAGDGGANCSTTQSPAADSAMASAMRASYALSPTSSLCLSSSSLGGQLPAPPGMVVGVRAAMATPLLLLLLLLLFLALAPAPVLSAAIGPVTKTGKFITKDLRTSTTINKSVKDYMGQRKDGQQTGSAAADSYGPFILDISLGTSPQTLPLIMDITSDLVWMHCDPCPSCHTLSLPPTPTPTFLPEHSKSFAEVGCATQACQRMKYHDCAGHDLCRYTMSHMSGFLATETFSFGNITGPGRTDVPGVAFGCNLNITLPEISGVSGYAGFSRGPLSLVSQLNISSFAYFIAPPEHDAGKSFVSWSWGGAADNATTVQTTTTGSSSSTPLLAATKAQNPYWYYVNLTGVQVDGKLLAAISAETFDVQRSGGVYLSTRFAVTFLVEDAYRVLRQELVRRIQSEGVAPVNVSSHDWDLCFLTEHFANAKVPTIALVFDGADAAMEVNVENYFQDLGHGSTCLTILPSPHGWPGSVLGSLLQAGRTMAYDIHSDGGGTLTFQTFETAAGAPATAKLKAVFCPTASGLE
ncbi:aspartic proteinase nepenthesin-1-like [Triticum aestivum]|uniref:aspartic proteinase nepenthesin-1-like n=1 Tax=Triticum aestivum TaxID=4565 RepID=UPI001D005966|nr:aspartic proteinase nepenthesin-1-like [Triticum aestivum]